MAERYSFKHTDFRRIYGVIDEPETDSFILADGTRVTSTDAMEMSEAELRGLALDAMKAVYTAEPAPEPSIAPAIPAKVKAPEIDL